MKKLQLVLLAAISFLFFVPQANATSFSFSGVYSFMDDAGDSDTFRETLHFSGGFFMPNSGGIHPTDPEMDSIDGGSVLIADLTLDVGSYASGSYFDFANSPYLGGFKVYNSVGVEQMAADLAVSRLDITRSTGSINSLFSMNLTNIVAGGSYSGGSVIIDEFLAASAAGYGGATNLTLQVAKDKEDFSSKIINALGDNGSSFGSTYSGSAAPVTVTVTVPAPVPEPSTLLLLGAGLVGLAFSNRQRTKA